MSSEKPEYAIFFDDSETHIGSFGEYYSKIKGVKIPATHPLEETPIDAVKDALRDTMDPTGEGMDLYINLIKSLNKPILLNDPYDSASGIQASHIDELRTWLDGLALDNYSKVAVIFDWDRTITMFEGIIKYNLLQSKMTQQDLAEDMQNKINESMMTYLLGGKVRHTMINNMLNMLSEKGVQIFILTNNLSCGVGEDFTKYVTLLTDKIPVANILCSFPAPYRGNKRAYLDSNPHFSLLKTPTTGGRRRYKKTRRSHKKRRTSKGKKYRQSTRK
jgi:hypothetical protein